MKHSLTILCLLFAAAAARADESKSTTFQPCYSWLYSSHANGYVCSFPSGTSTVYTASEVDQLLAPLQQQLQALDARVKKLEGHPED